MFRIYILSHASQPKNYFWEVNSEKKSKHLKSGGQIIKLAKKNNIDMFVKTKKKLKLLKIVLFGLVTCGLLTLSSCEKEDLPLEYSIDELVFLIKNNQLDNYQIEFGSCALSIHFTLWYLINVLSISDPDFFVVG